MKQQKYSDYQTASNIKVGRSSKEVPYVNAAANLIQKLNTHKGVLLSSSFEFPGRYTRWDVGFVNPPIMITAVGRSLTIVALNERGKVLLVPIYLALKASSFVDQIKQDEASITITLQPPVTVIYEEDRSRQITVFSVLRELIELFKYKDEEHLGLYGAFGYELAFQFEAINLKLTRSESARDLVLYLPDELLVVDHQKEEATTHYYNFEYLGEATNGLERTGSVEKFQPLKSEVNLEKGDHQPGEFSSTVSKAREFFARGDLFEAVPGQKFIERCIDSPADIFTRLQKNNPAPYGALMNLGEQEYLVAASPEMYVRVTGDRVETCPISGTIARGKDAIEDAKNIKTLINSLKDESELSMCTDVDRNDKSRVCEPGSVKVIGRRQLELYSRLIHTVDHVEGKLKFGFDALDAFLSHTWAVTVTGAPKQAAIQFIEDHEKSPRRWYGGAIGQLGFDGNMNTGLTLRTVHVQAGVAEIRAGATLLYDSDPVAEEAETRLKASALLSAIRNEYPTPETLKSYEQKQGKGFKVLMVDHQDSFVHTLSSYFQELGAEVKTVRPGQVAVALEKFLPELVVLSPGPGKPSDFHMHETITLCLDNELPIFGVCLGLQGIAEFFDGKLKQLEYPVHGKPSVIKNMKGKLFDGLNKVITVGRYHSLVAVEVPDCLEVVAETKEDNIVMALAHKSLLIMAVQFHPESILSLDEEAGRRIISNVVAACVTDS